MKNTLVSLFLAFSSILTINLEPLQAQEVDYFALAKREHALGHYSVALKAVMKCQNDSKFEDNPEVHFLRGKIEFFYYDIQTDQEQKSIRKQRAISAFERCIEKDKNGDYANDCKKYLDILENDPNYIKRITKGTFSIENYAALIDQKRYEEASAYYGMYLRGKVLVNEQLMYLEVRSNFELAKIKYGPNLELLDKYNTPSRIYLDELIKMDGAYCAMVEAYRDSINQLEKLWKQHVDLKLDRIVKLVKNENDSLEGQTWIDLIENHSNTLRLEYKGNLGFMYKSWGNAYAQLAFNDSIAEPKFEACFLAIRAFQESIRLEGTCKECVVKIEELKALNTKWNKETSSEGDNTDLVNQMFRSFQNENLLKALEKSDASIEIDSLAREPKTWYLRAYFFKGIWKNLYGKLNLEDDSLRNAAIDAYFKTYELDTVRQFSDDAMKSMKYLANTVYNDAAWKYNEHDVKEGRRLYNTYEALQRLDNPYQDFSEKRIEVALYEASIRSQMLENNENYDTLAANIIDSIYISILKQDPTNVSADYNLKTHRINDGVRRRAFLAALEKENELTKALSDRRRTQLVSISASLLLILILLAVALRAYRQKRKDNDFITAQKAEVEEAHHQLTEKNQEILDSINYAKRIQTAILPPSKLVKEYLHDSFILYKPKDVVAGDFYWMESVGDVVYFAAADCTGHGVPGAMVSVICVNGLNRSVREFGLRTPAEILDKTRELVIKEFEKSEEEVKDGMDISLCALNTKTNELQWAGANNPLWLVSSSEGQVARIFPEQTSASSLETLTCLFEIKANKQPIGKYGLEKPFTNHSIQLEKGDTIYIFSDGYPDQFGGERGKKYKSGNFKKTLVRISSESIEKQKQMLDQEFETWRGTLEQIDDVCVIGVRV